jgi:hypothetical protein
MPRAGKLLEDIEREAFGTEHRRRSVAGGDGQRSRRSSEIIPAYNV